MLVYDARNHLRLYDKYESIVFRVISRDDVDDMNYKHAGKLTDQQWADVRALVDDYLNDMVAVAIDDALEEVLEKTPKRLLGL